MSKRKLLIFSSVILLLVVAVIYICNEKIVDAGKGKLYSDVKSVPFNKTGLLLGTAKYVAGNKLNFYYAYRIDAAIQLIRDRKIKYLVISGDNGRKEYDEPSQMRSDLIKAGIDSAIIYLDFAGFRTFDSVVRLKEIFGQDSVTIISQPFHNERAIYIASREGISASGFNARDVSQSVGFRVQVREKLARVKVFVDYLFGNEPKFLGARITIPD